MRLTKSSPLLPPSRRGKSIEVTIDGQKALAYEGELVSTVLLVEGISTFARKHTTGRPSAVYCGMGVCYECLVTINGVGNIRACQTYVADQMVIETANQAER